MKYFQAVSAQPGDHRQLPAAVRGGRHQPVLDVAPSQAAHCPPRQVPSSQHPKQRGGKCGQRHHPGLPVPGTACHR